MTYFGNNITAIVTDGRLVYIDESNLPVIDYTLDTPASILAIWLIMNNVLTVPSVSQDWPLYVSSRPDLPDKLAVLYNTTPIKDARNMNDGSITQHYGLQLSLRSLTEEEGWAKCNLIVGILDAIHNNQISKDGVTYCINSVSRTGGINSLGYEQGTKRRRLFSVNLLITLTKI